jgi:uncharacterized phage protein gp47/JayE
MAESGFIIPTLQAIRDRVVADINAAVAGADSRLRKTALRGLAVGLSGISWGLHKFGKNISNEVLPDCASDVGVERWQSILGLPDVQPVKSAGTFKFTGTDPTPIPSGTEIARNDGVAYVTTAPAVMGSSTPGEVDVPCEAVIAGSDGDAVTGQTATLVVPIVGVDSVATVIAPGIVGGVDEETTEQLRIRVLERLADPPQGGSPADYREWVKESVPGTREVYVEPNTPTIGQVTVRFIVEPTDGDPVNAIPTTAQVDAAQDFIGGTVGASPYDFADAAAPVPTIGDRIDVREISSEATAFTFSALSPNTQAVQDAVEEALKALMLQRGEPGGTITLDQWIGAIDAAPGEDSATLDPATGINGSPPADVTYGADGFPSLGAVAFPP